MPIWEQIWQEACANFLAWLILALASALPLLGLWFFLPQPRRLFPPQRRRFVPWGGVEVCLVFFFTLVLVPALLYPLLTTSGFFQACYGPDFDSTPAAGERRFLWVAALAFPFQIAGILILLRGLSGTRLYQVGITSRAAARNLLLGWLAWLLLTPPVIGLNILVSWGYWAVEGVPPEEHYLARLARAQPLAIEWVLIGLTSVVLAPILEELLFRGVLQAWAAARPWGGSLILMTAFALSFGKWLLDIAEARDQNSLNLRSALHALEPAAFVLLMAAGSSLGERLLRPWLAGPYAARAIYSTAVLFAVFHLWPTPVPLFALGLGLGYLAHRTQNLLAPIVFHAMFNSVACLVICCATP